MSFNWLDQGVSPEESYSRKLDRRVAADEYPYGYDTQEPCAGYVNQGLIDDVYGVQGEKKQNLPWDYNTKAEAHPIPRSAKEQGSFPDHESKLKIKMGRRY